MEFCGVTKQFGSIVALSGASLRVNRGELMAVVGPSGCGKSRLLRIAGGYERADAGQVMVAGRDVLGLAPDVRNIGMVFQNYALFPHMTVQENVEFSLRMRWRTASVRRWFRRCSP